jgi:hypothetical protein
MSEYLDKCECGHHESGHKMIETEKNLDLLECFICDCIKFKEFKPRATH